MTRQVTAHVQSMTLSLLDPATAVGILRRSHQLKTWLRRLPGLKRQAPANDALKMIQTVGLRAAKAGQVGYVQDGTSLQLEFYRQMWESAAHEIGAEFTPIGESFWDVSYNGRETRLHMHQTELDTPVALNVAGDKALCHALLARGGLPVPDHLVFAPNQVSEAHAFMRQRPGYFVVKPAEGTSASRGITTYVRSFHDCTGAAGVAAAYSKRILIERMVPGELHRLLVLRGEVIHAIRRPGIRVRGDGRSSLAQLASRALQDLAVSQASGSAIDVRQDRDLLANLDAQDLTLQTVPAAGRDIIIKSHRTIIGKHIEETPLYGEDVTAVLAPEVRAMAIAAARLVHSEFAGVEMITPESGDQVRLGSGRVIEINTTPGLGPHFDLASTTGSANPAVLVLRALLGLS